LVTVLGGTGFIGQHVTRQLADAGAEVTTIARGTTASLGLPAQSLRADRADARALTRALATAAPTVVVDMVAYQQRDIEGLLEALPASVERLVVISSGDVYATYGAFLGIVPGPIDAKPSDERAPLRAELFPYRRQARAPDDMLFSYEKILVERAAMAWRGGATTILRLPMVYGPNDKQRRVAKYVEKFRAGAGPICLNAAEAAWRCTRGYVEDVAAAIRLAALSDAAVGNVFNVGEPEALSEVAWARAIAVATGWTGEIVEDPGTIATRQANWDVSVTVDTTRIRRVLGYDEPFGPELGLRRTVARQQSRVVQSDPMQGQ
jgi:nucleoside-diphosphate-sugar epimerase